jgi:hypothetical protein
MKSLTCETIARSRSICSEHTSRSMEFPTGYTETVLMIDQGDMVAGSNVYMITRISSLAGREHCILRISNNCGAGPTRVEEGPKVRIFGFFCSI